MDATQQKGVSKKPIIGQALEKNAKVVVGVRHVTAVSERLSECCLS